MESRRARVRKALGKSVLTRSNGARHLLNNYEMTQNEFNDLMYPRRNNTSGSGIEGSSRFLRTLRAPYNMHKQEANINFLTRPVARRTRRTRRRQRGTRK